MGDFILNVKNFLLKYKKTTVLFIVLILILGYYEYNKLTSTSGQTRFVLGSVQKGTLVTSITGTGQILTSNQIDLKPKVSGEITWIGIKAGDIVKAGQALMTIDGTTAKQTIANAERALITSQLQYQKDSASAPIDYQNTQNSIDIAKENLSTTFNSTFNSLSNTYLDLPAIITGAQNTLYGYDLNPITKQANVDSLSSMFSGQNQSDIAKISTFMQSAENDYQTARAKYDPSILAYKQIVRSSSQNDIATILTQTIDTTTAIAQALQSELNFFGAVVDMAQLYNVKLPSAVTTLQTNVRSYTSTVNTDLSDLLSQKKTIDTDNQTIKTNEQNLTLLQVGNPDGTNPISLQISKNNIASQQENIAQLKTDLANYTIVAPFSGTISAVNVKVGDNASSAAVASIITNQTLAQISLNEVDVAKIKAGDKATLTLDAIDGLSLSGSVVEIDSVGTISQGVVSYLVKINFDTQDKRILPGMTVNASIQTAVHQDVLYIPSGAIKTLNGTSYVMAFNPPLTDAGTSAGVISKTLPEQVTVQTGISDDTNIEILSGLNIGDQVVVRTITGTTATRTSTTPTATSLLGGGNNRGGGGGIRIGG